MVHQAARIAREQELYVRGTIDIDMFEQRVDGILEGTWPPPPEPCGCDEDSRELVEITGFGEAKRAYLCVTCGSERG